MTVHCILLPCMCRMSRRSCLRNGTSVVYFWTVLFLPFGLARNWTHEMYKRRAYLPRMKQSNLVYLATSQFLVRFTVSLKSVVTSNIHQSSRIHSRILSSQVKPTFISHSCSLVSVYTSLFVLFEVLYR